MRLAFGMLFGLLAGAAMAYEEPQYQLLFDDHEMEIRQYAPILIAEVYVDGDMDEASNKGFRLIANYIFGNNQAVNKPDSEKIAMTTPVTIEPQTAKIAMTTPVTVEPIPRDMAMQASNAWRVQFVMPSQYNLATIPKPNNSAVRLREIPEKYFVVLQYSGLNTVSKVQQRTDQALDWIKSKGLTIKGAPQLSRYNPPWTLPMFRRNEILIEIAKPQLEELKTNALTK